MIKQALSGVLDGIFSGADKIIDNFKVDPTKKLEAKLELRNMAITESKNLQEFAIQYEGDASQVPKWIVVLRSIIRPSITICMFFSFMVFLGYDIYKLLKEGSTDFVLTKLPTPYYAMLGIVLGFWFGGKAGERMLESLNKKNT